MEYAVEFRFSDDNEWDLDEAEKLLSAFPNAVVYAFYNITPAPPLTPEQKKQNDIAHLETLLTELDEADPSDKIVKPLVEAKLKELKEG